jgi:TetR/AcrR family transcriptional repressor of nem operon
MSAPVKTPRKNPAETQRKLIGATVRLMLRQGFAATTVDQICAEAGLTKGSFFHYFDTKEAIGLAAVNAWAQMGMELYSAAWKDPNLDPLEQFHRLIDVMCGFVEQPGDPVTCMVGMMSQEMSRTNAAMRKACAEHLSVWSQMVIRMLTEARKKYKPKVPFDPESVAWMLNSLWQGSMLVSKTKEQPQIILSNLRQARAYVDNLFLGTTAKPHKISKETGRKSAPKQQPKPSRERTSL